MEAGLCTAARATVPRRFGRPSTDSSCKRHARPGNSVADISTTSFCSSSGLTRTPSAAQPSAVMMQHSSATGPATVPHTPASRLRVAVDVDEVLGRFVYALNQYCLEMHKKSYVVDDYYVYEFAKIWGCSQDESNHIVHSFFESDHFNDGIPTIPGAFDTLQRLKQHCDLVVVTSRQHVIQDVTMEWLERHYPGIFTDVYFGNHFAMEGTSKKKSEICREIAADVLIDDNPTYALDCASAGIDVLLYDWNDSYPWSKLPSGLKDSRITVVRDWVEVESALRTLMHSKQV